MHIVLMIRTLKAASLMTVAFAVGVLACSISRLSRSKTSRRCTRLSRHR